METIQQQLANRLYELLPHKKELEFGCEVKIDSDEYPLINEEIIRFITCKPNGLNEVRLLDQSNWFKVSAISEIIGQPLRLADLLMAINQNTDEGIYVLDDGTFADREDVVLGEFNLSKDNILDQSDEFCKFALELLTTPPMAK